MLVPPFTSANTMPMVCLSTPVPYQLTLLLPSVCGVLGTCLLHPGHYKQVTGLLQYAVVPYFTDKFVVLLADWTPNLSLYDHQLYRVVEGGACTYLFGFASLMLVFILPKHTCSYDIRINLCQKRCFVISTILVIAVQGDIEVAGNHLRR